MKIKPTSLENKIRLILGLLLLLVIVILWAGVRFSSQKHISRLIELEQQTSAAELLVAQALQKQLKTFNTGDEAKPLIDLVQRFNPNMDMAIVNLQTNQILLDTFGAQTPYNIEVKKGKTGETLLFLTSDKPKRKLFVKSNLSVENHQGEQFLVYLINWPKLMDDMRRQMSSQRFNLQLMLIFAVVACFGIMATVYTIRRLISPINALTTQVERLIVNPQEPVDISNKDEVGRLAAVFGQLSESLKRSEQNQKQMIDSAAHELRTPVTIIQGHLEAAIHGLIPTDKPLLDSINQEVSSLSKLIEDLQLLSLAGAGELTINPKPCNITALVNTVIERFTPQLVQNNLAANIQLCEKSTVLVDEQRVGQVIKILLTNSCIHAVNAQNVTFESRIVTEGYQLDIWDDGNPVDESVKQKLFQPYFNANASSDIGQHSTTKGTGLGLTIARQLCRAMNCQLDLVDNTSQLKFRLVLPMVN